MAQAISGTGQVGAGPRLRGIRWGLGSLALAAAIAWYGAYGDPRHLASQEQAVPFIIAVATVVAVLVFGLLVPAGLKAVAAGSSGWTGGGLALGIVAVLAVPVSFWSGLPLILGVAAGLLGGAARRTGRRGTGTATVVLGVLAVVAGLALTILGNTLLSR